MKKILFALALSSAFVALGDATPVQAARAPGRKQLTPEQKAKIEQRMLEKNGGFIQIEGKGKVMVFNCQDKIPSSLIADRVKRIGGSTQMAIELSADKPEIKGAIPSLPKGVNVGVFVVDKPDLPISLLSLEEHWGVVNVAKLTPDNPGKEKFEKRFAKEFSRIMSVTMGGYISQTVNSSLQPVTTVQDLDSVVTEGIAFDTLQLINKHLKKLGITAPRRITYRKACSEGIAPAPANDYQKAVWEEMNAKPSSPIKIKYDPKKGE